MKTSNKKLTRGFAVAAAVACMSVSIVFATQVLLTPKQVAKEMSYPAVAAAFESENSIETNITQTDAGYIVSFLGLATGADLVEFEGTAQDGTYAVIAISKENGEAMTTTEEFFISPIIYGRNPLQYSALTMGGGFTATVIDGVLYRIVSCDSIEIFSHEGIQLCVNGGWMYDQSAFTMDATTGAFTANADYEGLNLVFDIPLDASLGDQAAVDAYIATQEATFAGDVTMDDGATSDTLDIVDADIQGLIQAIE